MRNSIWFNSNCTVCLQTLEKEENKLGSHMHLDHLQYSYSYDTDCIMKK